MISSYQFSGDAPNASVTKPQGDKPKRKALGDISLNSKSFSQTNGQKNNGLKPTISSTVKAPQAAIKFNIEEFHDPQDMVADVATPADPYDEALSAFRSKKSGLGMSYGKH